MFNVGVCEKGAGTNSRQRPFGCFALLVPDPFFTAQMNFENALIGQLGQLKIGLVLIPLIKPGDVHTGALLLIDQLDPGLQSFNPAHD